MTFLWIKCVRVNKIFTKMIRMNSIGFSFLYLWNDFMQHETFKIEIWNSNFKRPFKIRYQFLASFVLCKVSHCVKIDRVRSFSELTCIWIVYGEIPSIGNKRIPESLLEEVNHLFDDGLHLVERGTCILANVSGCINNFSLTHLHRQKIHIQMMQWLIGL